MVNVDLLKDYLNCLNKGEKILKNYNNLFLIFSFIMLCVSVYCFWMFGFLFYMAENPDGFSFQYLLKTFVENKNINLLGYIGALSLLSHGLLVMLHKFLIKRQMKKYLDVHTNIIKNHSLIFKSHSIENINAFSEERDKIKLLNILSTQSNHIQFLVDNYDDLSGQSDTISENDDYEQDDEYHYKNYGVSDDDQSEDENLDNNSIEEDDLGLDDDEENKKD